MTLDELKYLSARVQYDFGGGREKGYFYARRCNLITAADGVRNRELGRDRLLVIVHRPCLPTRSSENAIRSVRCLGQTGTNLALRQVRLRPNHGSGDATDAGMNSRQWRPGTGSES